MDDTMALSPEHRAGLDRALKAIAEAEAGPTGADLINAPVIDHWRPLRSGSHTIALWGNVSGHPLLGRDTATTSPLLAINVQAGWARTKSRWYALGRPFAALGAELAESMGVNGPAADFIKFALPGYLPLEKPDQLPELLANYIAWVREFDATDRAATGREG
ncbi:DUF6634 family protein [Paracoccus sp. KR1-242]|uniref:DUF6634 family protein n=1 Tax=Paracoccus sp. KR1-242 TaxID=3410028 RepID=UPI003C0C92EC